VIREFEGIDAGATFRPPLRVGWIGTSVMEHRLATSAALNVPWPVPEPGDSVEVTAIETGGFVRSVTDDYRVRFPHLRFATHNHAIGGATSRDLAAVCRELAASGTRLDLAFFGCGLNDVWRGFQGKTDAAVGLPEFIDNVSGCLTDLGNVSRRVVYVEETPFGPELEGLPTGEMNAELGRYMAAARGLAGARGCDFIPVAQTFQRTAAALGPEADLWADGVHLSRLGDHLLAQVVIEHSCSTRAVDHLSHLPAVDRETAPHRYRDLVNEAALLAIGSPAQAR
jgi:lysophospholipase L1-like esterase